MIKINNKRTFIALTIVASLALLVQPVQTQFPIRVFPQYFLMLPRNDDFVRQSKFFWRNVQAETGTYKVLTVELGDAEIQQDRNLTPNLHTSLIPLQLNAKDGFGEGFDLAASRFYWRDLTRDGVTFKVVTIEDMYQPPRLFYTPRPNVISPSALVGKAGFRSAIDGQTKFNKQNIIMDDLITYRAVTLEN